jgi:plastocyanin
MTNANPKVVALALLALAGCGGDGITGKTEKPERTPAISGAALNAGGEGVVTGTALDLLPATLTVDGVSVTPTARTTTEIRFAMPAGRPCEVDGRPIAIQAGTLTHSGALEVPSTINMEVGESRVLTREQLATLCLQLPAGSERYVFTAMNPSITHRRQPDTLLTVHAWTGSNAAAASAQPAPAITALHQITPKFLGAALGQISHEHPRAAPRPLQSSGVWHSYSDNPVPFDPRYTTATVGDTVTWANLDDPNVYCDEPRDRIPTFPVVVAAVSTSGKTVIAFDGRSRHGAVWLSAEKRAWLTRAANMAEQWAVPAVRAVIDPAYQPVKGAGGRWWHVFRTDVNGFSAETRVSAPQSVCQYASEIPVSIGADTPPQHDAQMEQLAAILIHEYAHHAEDVYAVRRWGTTFTPTGPATWGIHESWAQIVSETAARLASNQFTRARYSALTAGMPIADHYSDAYGERPTRSPFGINESEDRSGVYDQGTRFLMYMRERWGDAAANTTHERFYGRVRGLPRRDVPSLVALVGLTTDQALDQWTLADATDDLVDPAVAAARGLPQLESWVPQDNGPLTTVTISKTANTTRRLAVGRGNYAALYAWDYNADAGKGVSLTFSGFGSAPFLARITRLR